MNVTRCLRHLAPRRDKTRTPQPHQQKFIKRLGRVAVTRHTPMSIPSRSHRNLSPLAFVLVAGFILLACRAADLAESFRDARLLSSPTATRTPKATLVNNSALLAPEPTATETLEEQTPTETLEPSPEPTDTLEPTLTPLPSPTQKPVTPTPKPPPSRTQPPAPTFTPGPPTSTPTPTRCPQAYCAVVVQPCAPDGNNTVIEGTVYVGNQPENGVAVRVAKSPGAYPLIDDFVSGNDPINPGKPDKLHPGHYYLQVVAGAPEEGHWWVFVVDQPNGTKQISQAVEVHTNDAPTPGNCQHAFIDFVRQ